MHWVDESCNLCIVLTVNLAVALAKKCQLRVGLLDADIYGPSVPTMMKIHDKPEVTEGMAHLNFLLCCIKGRVEIHGQFDYDISPPQCFRL